MFANLRFRPIGWIAGIATLAAMAGMLAMAAGGGAAPGPEAKFEVNFEAHCILAPGVLNEAGVIKVHEVGEGPSTLEKGEEFSIKNGQISVVTPASWGETLFGLGSRSASGALTSTSVDTINAEPLEENIAKPVEFPFGLPIHTKVVNGPVEFTVPSENRTFTSGPYRVTGKAGEEVQGLLSTKPGFKETSAGHFESTHEGIQHEITGFNEEGIANVGPVELSCTAPANVTVHHAMITGEGVSTTPLPTTCRFAVCNNCVPEAPVCPPITSTYTTASCTPLPPIISRIEPDAGPEVGGTRVRVVGANLNEAEEVTFGGHSVEFTPVSANELVVLSPPGTGTVEVNAILATSSHACSREGSAPFTYVPLTEFNNWAVSGSLTVTKLRRSIALPPRATFNGSAEVNPVTGSGSVAGALSAPPFNTTFKALGTLPLTIGLTITPTGSLQGTVSRREAGPNDETLKIPARLDLGVTSVSVLGLTFPTRCTTKEPLLLALEDTLPEEELLGKAWSFAGNVSVPGFSCGGGFLGSLFAGIIDGLMSGPANAYSLKVESPPEVTSIAPLSGPSSGGTTVTITGKDFNDISAVRFGLKSAASYTVNSESSITAVTPPGGGVVDVTVTNAEGTSAAKPAHRFGYMAAQQVAELTSRETTPAFGSSDLGTRVSLSADGRTALAGGWSDDGGTGAAWIFGREGTRWAQQGAKLTARDETGPAEFGESAALSADASTALIGGSQDNGFAGAAWVFVRSGSSSTPWVQQGPKLTVNGAFGVGRSVALSADGDTALIGGGTGTWVFERSGSTWTQVATLPSSGINTAVALSGDGNTALIGVPGGGPHGGAGLVFTRSGSTWTEQATLSGPDYFGYGESVALSSDGNTALISKRDGGPGAASIFSRSGSTWALRATVAGSDETAEAHFGESVALSAHGNVALIGGPGDNESDGAAWLFMRSGASWTQRGGKLVPQETLGTLRGTGQTAFGLGVALSSDGGTLLIGGPWNDEFAGAAWVFSNLTPTVTQVEPAAGREGGGTSVVITGGNFREVSAVRFGPAKATSFMVKSETSITAIAPPGSGTVDVTVETSEGASPSSPADDFSY